jgi:hypothetical protein
MRIMELDCGEISFPLFLRAIRLAGMAYVYVYDLRLEGPRESDPTAQTRSRPKTVYVRMKRSMAGS